MSEPFAIDILFEELVDVIERKPPSFHKVPVVSKWSLFEQAADKQWDMWLRWCRVCAGLPECVDHAWRQANNGEYIRYLEQKHLVKWIPTQSLLTL